ncbi:SPW repeat domain-containing protein [Rhodococcus sp. NPDC003348]
MTVDVADSNNSYTSTRNTAHAREVRRDIFVVTTGVALVLLSLWLPTQGDDQITGAILILGMIAYSVGLWAMTTESRTSHWGLVVLGVALLLTPVAMAFPSGTTGAAVVSVVAGVIVLAVGIVGLATRRDEPTPARHRREARMTDPWAPRGW